jgi:hypothetical protein
LPPEPDTFDGMHTICRVLFPGQSSLRRASENKIPRYDWQSLVTGKAARAPKALMPMARHGSRSALAGTPLLRNECGGLYLFHPPAWRMRRNFRRSSPNVDHRRYLGDPATNTATGVRGCSRSVVTACVGNADGCIVPRLPGRWRVGASPRDAIRSDPVREARSEGLMPRRRVRRSPRSPSRSPRRRSHGESGRGPHPATPRRPTRPDDRSAAGVRARTRR